MGRIRRGAYFLVYQALQTPIGKLWLEVDQVEGLTALIGACTFDNQRLMREDGRICLITKTPDECQALMHEHLREGTARRVIKCLEENL